MLTCPSTRPFFSFLVPVPCFLFSFHFPSNSVSQTDISRPWPWRWKKKLKILVRKTPLIEWIKQQYVKVGSLAKVLKISLKAELAFCFSRTSQGHNALPRPGLEPVSSNSEPSALTTGLLDKAVALACPRYSWPRMLKVAPCTDARTVISPIFFGLMGYYYHLV